MTVSTYTPLVLASIFVNAPLVTTKFFGVFPLKRKHFRHHLVKLAAGFILTAVPAYILESRVGAVQHQDREFYAIVVCLHPIFAFPCFVWCYFWHARNCE